MKLCVICNEKVDSWAVPFKGRLAHMHCTEELRKIKQDERMKQIFKIPMEIPPQ